MMKITWQKMAMEEYAGFERSQGEKVVKVNEIYWKQLRPFFYRPLLPFREFPAGSVRPPIAGLLGGYQFAVLPQEKENSRLNMLIFQDPRSYTLDTLERHKRKQVISAAKEFTVRPLEDVSEFKEKAHSVYLSFYDRTNYGYKSERRDKKAFARWAELLYQFPKNLILGAFRNSDLHAVSVSKLVEDTVIYSMMFCTNEALRYHVPGFLLHLLREGAAECTDAKQMFVGMYKYRGRTGVDDYYFVRGCQLVSKPAALRLNPLAMLYLRNRMPNEYLKLRGKLETEIESLAAAAKPHSVRNA